MGTTGELRFNMPAQSEAKGETLQAETQTTHRSYADVVKGRNYWDPLLLPESFGFAGAQASRSASVRAVLQEMNALIKEYAGVNPPAQPQSDQAKGDTPRASA